MKKTTNKIPVSLHKTMYNKVQLTYLNNRVDAAINGVMDRWDERHPEPDEITDDEKYDQIANGTAKLRSWETLRRCHRDMRTDLEDAYDFVDPREKERKACADARIAMEHKMEKLRKKAEELIYLGDQAQLLSFIETIEDMQPLTN